MSQKNFQQYVSEFLNNIWDQLEEIANRVGGAIVFGTDSTPVPLVGKEKPDILFRLLMERVLYQERVPEGIVNSLRNLVHNRYKVCNRSAGGGDRGRGRV